MRMSRGTRGVGVDVDRVRVADGLDPVVDHRGVHRIAPEGRRARPGVDDRLRGGADVAHRFALGSPSPAVAIMSRITSLTPPPKVITTFLFS